MSYLPTLNWIHDFLNCLISPKSSELRISQALEIKNQNLPACLYKYREINEYSLRNLENNTVWLSSPQNQNDLFDSSFHVSGDAINIASSNQTVEKALAKPDLKRILSTEEIAKIKQSPHSIMELSKILLEKAHPGEETKNRKALELAELAPKAMMTEIIRQLIQQQQKNMRVCSFSSVFDSNKMWGHYSKSHTGFCLEYDFSSLDKNDIRRTLLYPVIYRDQQFDATPYLVESLKNKDFNNHFGVLAAIHKTTDWSYENEWRFVAALGSTFPEQDYLMPQPSKIYLGQKISQKNKENLLSIAKRKGIPSFQMRISANSSTLDAEKVSD